MKGWVYVISNRAMPDIIKVGYSAKDPDLRAEELNHTGSPHAYIVDYEVLVEHPYRLEQQVHGALSQYSEGKEWFRCEVEVAVAAIKEAAAGHIIHETFKRANRDKALSIQREKTEKEELERIEAYHEQEQVRAKSQREQQIREIYDKLLLIPVTPYWLSWLWFSLLAVVLGGFLKITGFERTAFLLNELSYAELFLWSVAIGAVAAPFVKKWEIEKEQKSDHYKALLAMREAQLEKNRSGDWEISDHYKALLAMREAQTEKNRSGTGDAEE